MNKKVLIIINGYGVADGVRHQLSRLEEEFTKVGFETQILKNTEVLSWIFEGEIKNKLPENSLILYLDKDKYVAEMIEKAGYKIHNSAASIEKCDDKMLTHIVLSNNGIKMPSTISSALCYRDTGNRDYLNIVQEKLGYPMIVKENFGSLGKQVYLVNNHDELLDMENKLLRTPHLFQQFISSSRGKDFRLIVVGGKVIATMKRENKNSYLSNLATGGVSSVVELPESYIKTAEKAAKILGLDYCGVDILEGANHEPILSEVNSNAFFEGIEKTTGINVAGEYVKFLINNYFYN